ncbi:HdeA/HdeB family chaperone [Beggiatoa leptomitoformis]|uniref:Acid stress chaperone HdeB n=1 Tax=Beggiatoa leptomitoformis TaxID=288004 RepID=A0A2N9YDW0_9GAMM|nr:HdeA/HdeB family chaperone [Beggiatoa leptomitoformis]ALG68934.1 hypothetical protein AL038_16060 [Beggiatoa leptomitoformis]AUI68682.1 hypothetical protein BLE401_08190 [Beggiatoa leptomitoformis]
MKKLFGAIALLACLGATPLVNAAGAVDLKNMTCKDLDGMDKETASMMLFWLDGYLSGVTDDTSFDPASLGEFVNNLAKACSDKPDGKVLEFAKEVGISESKN